MTNLFKHSELKATYTNAQGQTVKVYVTKAYDDFILIEANREVTDRVVKKVVASMTVKVEHAPILVNEKAEVIDGQNRLESYRRLGKPITFEMIEGLSVETIRRLNTIQKEWSVLDHLHAGAVQDDVSYKYLNVFCEVHKLQPATALVLMKGTSAGVTDAVSEIRQGVFKCSIEERKIANQRVTYLEHFRGYSKATTKHFAHALCRVLEVKGLDPLRLVSTFQARYKTVLKGSYASYENYMFQLQEMYNYKLSENKKLSFLSKMELERLNRRG